jgi:hypothetical protein
MTLQAASALGSGLARHWKTATCRIPLWYGRHHLSSRPLAAPSRPRWLQLHAREGRGAKTRAES